MKRRESLCGAVVWLALMGLSGCTNNGKTDTAAEQTGVAAKETAKSAGSATEQTAHNAASAADKAADRVGNAANNAADNTREAANNAANGTGNEANNTVNAADHVGNNAEHAVKELGKNVTAALVVTPKVKNALLADKQLNSANNKIDVDSADNVVHIKGHVANAALKKRATHIAQQVLNQSHSTDKLSNELQVGGAQ